MSLWCRQVFESKLKRCSTDKLTELRTYHTHRHSTTEEEEEQEMWRRNRKTQQTLKVGNKHVVTETNASHDGRMFGSKNHDKVIVFEKKERYQATKQED